MCKDVSSVCVCVCVSPFKTAGGNGESVHSYFFFPSFFISSENRAHEYEK